MWSLPRSNPTGSNAIRTKSLTEYDVPFATA